MKELEKNKKVISISLPFLIILILGLSAKSTSALDRMTTEEGMKKITELFYQYASQKEINRPVAYKTEDWPSNITRFIKMDKGELPIMGSTGFESSSRGTLEVAGVTKQGEILQYLGKTRIVSIPNPLSRRPDTSGIWYKVRMLNGVEGWLFVKPDDSSAVYASYFDKKVIPQTKPAKTKPEQPTKQTQKTESIWNKWFTEEDLRNIKTALIILAALILFIIIVSNASKRKSTASHPSSYPSGRSSGYSYDSSSPSSSSASMSAETKEEEKDKSEWPFREKDMLFGKKNIIEKHEVLPDQKVGEMKENLLGNTEVHKKTWYGTEKVGEVKRGFFGGPKSIETKDGGSYKIKETFFGRKIIVDEDGNEIGEYKGD